MFKNLKNILFLMISISSYFNAFSMSQKIFNFHLKQANEGKFYAQVVIGDCYEGGICVEKNLEKAFEWYLKAALSGKSNFAAIKVIHYYEKGTGVEKNLKKAFKWRLRIKDWLGIGRYYEKGIYVEKNLTKAFEYYSKATEDIENYMVRRDACKKVARCYKDGIGTEQNPAKAFEYYRKAALELYSSAKKEVAHCYKEGFGVEKNLKKAFKWYVRAKDWREVGHCYENGQGVEKDLKKAFESYLKAAEEGCYSVREDIIRCYENGIGVEKSSEKALEWKEKEIKLKFIEFDYELIEKVKQQIKKAESLGLFDEEK